MFNRSLVIAVVKNCRQVSTNPKLSTEAAVVSKKSEYYESIGELKENDTKPPDWHQALPFDKIPGPKSLPIIGNIWRFFPHIGDFHGLDLLQLHEKMYKDYGPISTMGNMLGDKMVFVYEPDSIEKVLRNEGAWPIRYGMPSFVRYRTKTRKHIFKGVPGLLSVQGKEWYDIRSKTNPILMQPRNAARYTTVMDEIASELVERIREYARLNPNGEMPAHFINELYKWALESIGVIAIDKRLGCLEPNLDPDSEPQKIINSVLKMFELSFKLDVLPSFARLIPTRTWREFVEVMDTITYTLLKYVEESKSQMQDNKLENSSHEKSVLEKLLAVDEKIALATALDLMTAGIDTTGRTMGAALYFLARNPEKQAKLREEILKLLPSKETKLDKDLLNEAPYLRAVIKETTRIAPIAIGNLRSTVRDMVLCGYQIPKGTQVVTINLVLSNLDKYVLNAKEFIPERFLRTTTCPLSHKNVHPFVQLPFGFGPRSCIGKRLANLELEVGITKVIRNFELSWPHEDMIFETKLLYGIGRPLRLQVKEINY